MISDGHQPGHCYLLESQCGTAPQIIQFIEKDACKDQSMPLLTMQDHIAPPAACEASSGAGCSAPYGFCPNCHAKGISRERRPHGNDRCVNGHTYPSDSAIVDRFIPSKKQMDDEWMEFSDELRKKYGEVGKAVFMHWCEQYGLPTKPNVTVHGARVTERTVKPIVGSP